VLKDPTQSKQVEDEKLRKENIDLLVQKMASLFANKDCKNYLKFMKANMNEQKKIMSDDSGLGVMMFCACLTGLEDFFPIIDVEFDCRGGIQFNGDSVTVTAGEIKSSEEGVKYGKSQLYKRLSILQQTLQIVNDPKKPPIKCVLNGVLFLPIEARNSWRELDTLPTHDSYNLSLDFV
jgi:hypothetical protein